MLQGDPRVTMDSPGETPHVPSASLGTSTLLMGARPQVRAVEHCLHHDVQHAAQPQTMRPLRLTAPWHRLQAPAVSPLCSPEAGTAGAGSQSSGCRAEAWPGALARRPSPLVGSVTAPSPARVSRSGPAVALLLQHTHTLRRREK